VQDLGYVATGVGVQGWKKRQPFLARINIFVCKLHVVINPARSLLSTHRVTYNVPLRDL
jgi:hypothetical protein